MGKDYLDVLRWIAAISVITVHAAMNAGNEIIHYLFNWGVPIFVMISGALLLDPTKEISMRDICLKYVRRVVLTIIIAGSILNVIESTLAGKPLTLSLAAESVIGSVTGDTPQHFWYLYMIIGIYLLTPLLKTFLQAASDQLIQYTIIILFLALSVVPFFKQILQINFIFYLPITSIYFLYYLLGYVLHYKQYITLPKHQLGIIAFFMLFAIFSVKYFGELVHPIILHSS